MEVLKELEQLAPRVARFETGGSGKWRAALGGLREMRTLMKRKRGLHDRMGVLRVEARIVD